MKRTLAIDEDKRYLLRGAGVVEATINYVGSRKGAEFLPTITDRKRWPIRNVVYALPYATVVIQIANGSVPQFLMRGKMARLTIGVAGTTKEHRESLDTLVKGIQHFSPFWQEEQ